MKSVGRRSEKAVEGLRVRSFQGGDLLREIEREREREGGTRREWERH